MAGALSTGVRDLDRDLHGGLPPGSLVALVAPPESESELLLRELMGERPTLYVTTTRSERIVETEFERRLPEGTEYVIEEVGPSTALPDVTRLVEQVDFRANVIVDTANPLERREDREAYRAFLNGIKAHALGTGGVCVLHCTEHGTPPPGRETTLTMADSVLELRSTLGTTEVEQHLAVRKFRGGMASDIVIKLDFGEGVAIDTSRDIG